jgi:hypothetical protein
VSEGAINWGALMEGVKDALQPVPKGPYDVVVAKCEAKTSSTNKSMWAMQLKIIGGPHDGRIIFNNLTLTTDNPQALRMFFMNMSALGLEQSFFASNPTPSQIANALVGRNARVEIDHRQFQGQMRENVKRLMPPGGVFPAGAVPSGGPGVPGVPQMPTPASSPSVPSPPPVAAPSIPAPQPQPAPTESTVPIPAPVAPAPPAPPAEPEEVPHATAQEATLDMRSPEVQAAEAAPALPPGMTQEQFTAFMAWQSQQAAATMPDTPAPTAAGAMDVQDAEPATTAPVTAEATSPAPGATPPPPPVPF